MNPLLKWTSPACGLYRDGVALVDTLVTVAPSAGLGPATIRLTKPGLYSTELRGQRLAGTGSRPFPAVLCGPRCQFPPREPQAPGPLTSLPHPIDRWSSRRAGGRRAAALIGPELVDQVEDELPIVHGQLHDVDADTQCDLAA
jgi:hypothetical protein